jgi:hypothetical protein
MWKRQRTKWKRNRRLTVLIKCVWLVVVQWLIEWCVHFPDARANTVGGYAWLKKQKLDWRIGSFCINRVRSLPSWHLDAPGKLPRLTRRTPARFTPSRTPVTSPKPIERIKLSAGAPAQQPGKISAPIEYSQWVGSSHDADSNGARENISCYIVSYTYIYM